MNLQKLEQAKMEIEGKLGLFYTAPEKYGDLIDKLSKQLDAINKQIELAEKIKDTVDIQNELKAQRENQINDNTLNIMYDSIEEKIERIELLKAGNSPYHNTFKLLKDELVKMQEREELCRSVYPDKQIMRPYKVTLFLQQAKAMEKAIVNEALEYKKANTTLTPDEENGLKEFSIDSAIDFLNKTNNTDNLSNVEGGEGEE